MKEDNTAGDQVSCCGCKFHEHVGNPHQNVRHFFPILDSLLSAVAIIVFGILTYLDKNVLYCIIIAHFGIILVVSVRIVVIGSRLWSPSHKRSVLGYLWLTL